MSLTQDKADVGGRLILAGKSGSEAIQGHYLECEYSVQHIGITIGIKSGDLHMADMRVCNWNRKHLEILKTLHIPNANEDDILKALDDMPLGGDDKLGHQANWTMPNYITDTTSLLPLDPDDYHRINTHEKRTVGLLFNLVADPKISKMAKVYCKRFGVKFTPATAVVATIVGKEYKGAYAGDTPNE